jgi:hypothetical protein
LNSRDTLRRQRYQKLRIFLSSPGDVETERERVHDIVAELNEPGNIADFLGFFVEVYDWRRDASARIGPRAQTTIFDESPVETWDIFIGILWLTFGSPPGRIDPETGRPFASGTEEEFLLAYRSWQRCGRPRILFYRSLRGEDPRRIDGISLGLVQAFFQHIDATNSGLACSFDGVDRFVRRVRHDLTRILIELFGASFETQFGRVLSGADVIGQVRAAWEGQDLLLKLLESMVSGESSGRAHNEALLGRLVKFVGNPQAMLVCYRPEPSGWQVAGAVNVSHHQDYVDTGSGLLAQLVREPADYIEFAPGDRRTDDAFYGVFDPRRTIENFVVWQGGRLVGFVAFASDRPLIGQGHVHLIRTVVRVLVHLA